MIDKDTIEERGITSIDGICSIEEIIRFSMKFGRVCHHPDGELIKILKPSVGDKSPKGSFSNKYGLAQFPLHTDTAFWSKPARYITFAMLGVSSNPTHYVRFEDIIVNSGSKLIKLGRESVYLLSTYEGSKYTCPILDYDGNIGIRFDSNIMKPANEKAHDFHKIIMRSLDEVPLNKIDWTGSKAAVLDNWKILHGRSAVNDKNRELIRIYGE